MSYDARERSIEEGRPVYLYLFMLGVKQWRYTSADEDISIGGETWAAIAISDDGIAQSGEPTSDALTITAPIDSGPAQMFMGTPPSKPIQVAILHKHEGDAEAIVCYSGEVSQVNFSAPGVVQIMCIAISATMQRDGLRLGWQRMCPYALYDPSTCKVNKSQWGVASIVNTIYGDGHVSMATSGGYAGPHFAGGFMEWYDPIKGWTTRMIEAQGGPDNPTLFLMFGATDDMVPGLVVTMYPGCSRTVAACAAFNNSLNYGGCAYMPGKSPFDGTPVF